MATQTDKAQGAAIIIITLFVIVVIAILMNKFFKGFGSIAEILGLKKDEEDKRKEAEQKSILQAQSEKVKNMERSGVRPSYSQATYLQAANTIHEAINKSGLDDNNETALKTFLYYAKKQIDVEKLIEAYGSRPHYWFGVKRPERTLLQALTEELNADQKKRLNNEMIRRKLSTRIN